MYSTGLLGVEVTALLVRVQQVPAFVAPSKYHDEWHHRPDVVHMHAAGDKLRTAVGSTDLHAPKGLRVKWCYRGAAVVLRE
jgi:hypothetical protein